MARVSAARVWKWVRLLGRNYASFPIVLTLLAWFYSTSWLLGYYVANTAFVFVSPYVISVGTGKYSGNTTQFYSFRYDNVIHAIVGRQTRPEIYGDATGHVAVIPFWLVIAVFAPFAFMQWRSSLRDFRIPPGHCLTCGYDLTGNISGICPECGGKVTELPNGPPQRVSSERMAK